MTHIEPGLFALLLLAAILVGGFGVVLITKLFAMHEEKVFWKLYDERNQNV